MVITSVASDSFHKENGIILTRCVDLWIPAMISHSTRNGNLFLILSNEKTQNSLLVISVQKITGLCSSNVMNVFLKMTGIANIGLIVSLRIF